jgi:hypothetical protein
MSWWLKCFTLFQMDHAAVYKQLQTTYNKSLTGSS